MPSGMTDLFRTGLLEGLFDLGTGGDLVHVALFENDYTFAEASDTTYTIVAAGNTECTGTGYTLTGEPLTGQVVTAEAGNVAKWDAVDTPWGPGATITDIFNALIYKNVSPFNIIANVDFVTGQSVSSGTFTIVWNGSGIITLV